MREMQSTQPMGVPMIEINKTKRMNPMGTKSRILRKRN
jgi:hypothetical protein